MLKHTSSHNEPDLDLLVELGYEPRDVAFRTLAGWIGALFVFAAATCFVMLGLFRWFVPEADQAQEERAYPLRTVRRLPPGVQLQADPRRDMALYHASEDKSINDYNYAEENGVKTGVNIPIDKAIDEYAANVGIAGVKGTRAAKISPSYPGSGNYERTPTKTSEIGDIEKPGATAPARLNPSTGEMGQSPIENIRNKTNPPGSADRPKTP